VRDNLLLGRGPAHLAAQQVGTNQCKNAASAPTRWGRRARRRACARRAGLRKHSDERQRALAARAWTSGAGAAARDWGARERTRRGSCRRPRRRTSTPGTPRSSPSTWTRRPRLFRCPPVWQEPHPSSWMAPLLLCRTCNCDEIFEVPCLSTLITAPVRNSANAHRSQYVQLTCH
jgi:hypothetical protein